MIALPFSLLPSCLCKPLFASPGKQSSAQNQAAVQLYLHVLVSQSWPDRRTRTKPSPKAPFNFCLLDMPSPAV